MKRESGLKILVVDDNAGHRNMLRTLLSDWGYAVASAEDGEEAVRYCCEQSCDVVLMDIRMPKKSGFEAFLEIHEARPSLPVLMMTAYSDVEAAVAAIKAGAYDYLTKPLDFEKLKITLRNVCAYLSLEKEHNELVDSLASPLGKSGIVGQSETMRGVLEMALAAAPSEATCLILGESGTGKELIAKFIHMHSSRKDGPYVAFNCAALTDTLIESELFGHVKGAFTGADKQRAGRFIQADGGTLFLDEVGEMPIHMQAKLLRVLQEREVQPVGSEKTIHVNVRIIAATNKNLMEEVAAGRFREDLYYRLDVVSLHLPPLRERSGDIELLSRYFLGLYAHKNHKAVKGISPRAMEALLRYSWPGNVRELENTLERAIVLLSGDTVTERELPLAVKEVLLEPGRTSDLLPPHDISQAYENGGATCVEWGENKSGGTLRDYERSLILQTLTETGGNKSEAARRLGITRKTLHMKLHKYGYDEESTEADEL